MTKWSATPLRQQPAPRHDRRNAEGSGRPGRRDEAKVDAFARRRRTIHATEGAFRGAAAVVKSRAGIRIEPDTS